MINIKLDDLISLRKAVEISGFSAGHLNYLVRKNKLPGMKLGRNWFITRKTLEIYLRSNRKPGRKKRI